MTDYSTFHLKGDEEKFLLFGRKIQQHIYGPIMENEKYRMKTNEKVY